MFLGETHNTRRNAAVIGIGGLLSALLYLMAFVGMPGGVLMMQLSPLPILYVGFQADFKSSCFASLLALIGVATMGSLPLLVNFVGSIFGMALVASFVLFQHKIKTTQEKKQGTRLGQIIFWMMCFSLFLLVLGQWSATSQLSDQKFFEEFLTQMEAQGIVRSISEEQKQLLFAIAQFMPGIMSALWLFVFVGLVFLAQNLHARKSKRTPLVSMAELHLPEGCLYLLMMGLLGCFLSQKNLQILAVNSVLVLLVPFLLKGLSIIHYMLAHKPQRKALLIALYILSFLLAWPLLCIALFGLYTFLRDQNIFRLKTDLRN